ncbi:NAD(P)-dependent oxidoreductase [uncultured Oscillibacter sp.]|uniref:NAD-dependent epimerase/dehydratase family protein n=1 Tax=uncultured Oscillibacter sp. TaxID=876091 RepID=UPI00260C3530|nr:NAD(P)-dependent oxidoreductase [uncultured Oscillibacter sp.]
MNVLVTGCNGFIGSHICRMLMEEGHRVCGLSHSAVNKLDLEKYYSADISSQGIVEATAARMGPLDVVVHCAAHISYDGADSRLMAVNAVGTQNIVTLAKRCGVSKFLYCSSMPVIGVPIMRPITENHPLAPTTMYHASKLAGEYIVKASGIKSVILRIPSPVGPGMSQKTLLPIVVSCCLKNVPIRLYGTGGRIQNYISVLDVARAVCLSLNRNVEGCFNLSGDSISNLSLARMCREITSSHSEIIFTGEPDPADGHIWEVSGERAAEQMGFVPDVGIEESILALIRSYGRNE